MNVKAIAKFVHIAPRKVRLVVNLVRGLEIEEARKQLRFSPKAASEPVLKVLNSAIANAQNNFQLDTQSFVITKAFVDAGPVIKRYTQKAHGSATPIRHRMSHITIEIGSTVVKKEKQKKGLAKKLEKTKSILAEKSTKNSEAKKSKANT